MKKVKVFHTENILALIVTYHYTFAIIVIKRLYSDLVYGCLILKVTVPYTKLKAMEQLNHVTRFLP